MTLDQILKYINYICVKENSGSTLKPDQYNIILIASNTNMFNRWVSQAQMLSIQSKVPFSQTLFDMATLRDFHVMETISFTAGEFDLTTLTYTYAYWGSMVSLYEGTYREIEILTDKDMANRRSNLLARQLNEYPGAMILGNTVKVFPSDIDSADFVYMKNPTKPIYDYYIDANFNIVYLANGASHLLTTGETGSAGQTAGTTVTSNTVELEWNELYHIEFCNEVLQKVGIQLKDEQIRQYVREVEGQQK